MLTHQNFQSLQLRIEVALQRPKEKTEKEIYSLAVEYRDACQEVASRTTLCINYLRQGFRAEAIRLAEIEPDIFSCAAALDLRKRAKWVSFGSSVGVTTPELPWEMIHELQETMESYEKLAKEVRYYRRLNIFRRSKSSRAKVLKLLHKREPGNAVWRENLGRLK